ncbi:MAG TPA: type II toxin-antitoxin system VapC family toxin [Terriglobales bacterium]|jgi:PIN domain nuclease of toxin-antitoxin system
MKYLLDTVVWMWSIGAVEKISEEGRAILENGREEIYLSAVTSWELSIKMRLGKLQLSASPARCVPEFMAKQGLRSLAITHIHAAKVYDLPLHHADPFDRLLIAQALIEETTILTADHAFEKYHVPIVWCGT